MLIALSTGCASPRTRAQHQRDTMRDMVVVATALDAYAREHGGLLPSAEVALIPAIQGSAYVAGQRPVGLASDHQHPTEWPTVLPSDVHVLSQFLVPRYLRSLPLTDAWGYPIHLAISDDLRSFILASYGSDGVIDTARQDRPEPSGGNAATDLVLANGVWVCCLEFLGPQQ